MKKVNKYKLVSIIIPVYNREYLIKETLDSIKVQTYSYWECLIVDDGSTDNTKAVINTYVEKDSRFKLFNRPKNKPKGANACRNIGLEKACGDYIVFFDSDDIMTPNHLEIKYGGFIKDNYDFVITRTKYFNSDNSGLDGYYAFDKYTITPYNYITQKINWLTLDVCIKSNLAKSIRFNEKLQSGQEFNYFSKLVYKSCNAYFEDKVISLRRKHDSSTRGQLKTHFEKIKSLCFTTWYTYLDIERQADKNTRLYLLRFCLRAIYKEQHYIIPEKGLFLRKVVKELGLRGFYLLPMLWSHQLLGRGYYFRKALFKAIPELP